MRYVGPTSQGLAVVLAEWRAGELVEAARKRGFWLCWCSVYGSCYEDSAGCVIVIVGEAVGDAA